MQTFDLDETPLRELNATLHRLTPASNAAGFRIVNPRGRHAVAVGVDAPVKIEIAGNVGYYCAGMNKQADITIDGSAGVGLAENMMSGRVHVKGDASASAGATGCGGLLIIDGNAGARCGISNRGLDIVVKGNVGHMSGFMGQAGHLVVLGDAGDALGDSLYEMRIFVRGTVKSLGADCIAKPLEDAHKATLRALLDKAGIGGTVDVGEFHRYGSARKLYNFHIDNLGSY
jgi:glutamate synthase domain-containing protein 3